MGRKKVYTEELVMVSRRIPKSVWERFQHFCDYHVPRASDTEMMIKAFVEFLDRHEPKQSKAAKR